MTDVTLEANSDTKNYDVEFTTDQSPGPNATGADGPKSPVPRSQIIPIGVLEIRIRIIGLLSGGPRAHSPRQSYSVQRRRFLTVPGGLFLRRSRKILARLFPRLPYLALHPLAFGKLKPVPAVDLAAGHDIDGRTPHPFFDLVKPHATCVGLDRKSVG